MRTAEWNTVTNKMIEQGFIIVIIIINIKTVCILAEVLLVI